MTTILKIAYLLSNEFKLEWRGKAAINSILLYIVSITYILHVSFNNVEANLWNALFWIVITFSSVNAVAKSFMGMSEGNRLYYYSIIGPEVFFVSKIIYNFLLLFVLAIITKVAMMIFVEDIPIKSDLFWLSVLLGCIGYSFIMTMISAIAAKAKSGSSLMAILSFPIIIPMLMFLLDVSIKGILGSSVSETSQDLLVMSGLNVLIFSTGYLLFPYLWRD